MKTLFLAFLLALIGTVGFTQSRQEIDSLRHELARAKHDSNRVLALVELAFIYQNANPDTALRYGQQALDLAQKIKFLRGQARAFHALGIANRLIGDLPKGFDLVFKGLQIAEENNFPYETARCLNLLGFFFGTNLGDGPKALDYFRRGLATIKKETNSKEKWAQEAQILRNIGTVYRETKNLDSAAYYNDKALQIQQEANVEITPLQINNLGRDEFMRGRSQKAMAYSRQAIQRCKNNNDHRSAGIVYHTLATYFKDLSQPDSAIYYSTIGLAESQSINFKEGILLNSRLLTELYESGDIRKAYEYQKIAIATNEDINGLKKIQSLQKTIIDELLRQREVEAERVAYQNRLKQYAFLVGLGILLLVAFILYRANQQKNKANHLLHRQKEEINHQREKAEKALIQLKSTQAQLVQKEKLASLGELTAGIAHEIQNPLNFVNNFAELSVDLAQELNEELDKEPIDKVFIKELMSDLTQNQEKINLHGKRASSIVKGMLEHSRQSTGERELTDINQLADEYLRLSYHGLRAKDSNFNCDYELIADENLPKVEVIPQDMGRVLLNLINNAFYAVLQRQHVAALHTTPLQSQYQPTVTISTYQSDNQIIIKVTDNGIGMSDATKSKIFQPFFTTKPTGEGTGLGLSLSYDIVTKGHGGTIEVESVEGEATTFTVKLPLNA